MALCYGIPQTTVREAVPAFSQRPEGSRAPQEISIPSALQQDEELGPEGYLSLQSLAESHQAELFSS